MIPKILIAMSSIPLINLKYFSFYFCVLHLCCLITGLSVESRDLFPYSHLLLHYDKYPVSVCHPADFQFLTAICAISPLYRIYSLYLCCLFPYSLLLPEDQPYGYHSCQDFRTRCRKPHACHSKDHRKNQRERKQQHNSPE